MPRERQIAQHFIFVLLTEAFLVSRELRQSDPMTNVIVIPTHRSGVAMLDNLLTSFNGYDKYPILIVVCDYKRRDKKIFSSIREKFARLPISWEQIKTNSFELGGLYTAYEKTNYDELLLLSHSCEIVNPEILDLVFEKHSGKSVAFALQTGNWKSTQGENRRFTLKHLDHDTNLKLLKLGDIEFWQAHLGKYRRAILDQMNLKDYLPTNMIEAISKSELLFTSGYHSLDPTTVVLFPNWKDGDVFEEKFGRMRLKIMNEYIIKWKTHWNVDMVFDDVKNKYLRHRVKKLLRLKLPTVYASLNEIRKQISNAR
jgi:hypothetical protein